MIAAIVQSTITPDGATFVSFEIRDDDETVLAVHSQGFAPERERVPEPRTRSVPQRADDGSGDVVRGDDNQPVMLEEQYEEMVETGRVLPACAETIREGIKNYVRDVLALQVAQPSVTPGETFEV